MPYRCSPRPKKGMRVAILGSFFPQSEYFGFVVILVFASGLAIELIME